MSASALVNPLPDSPRARTGRPAPASRRSVLGRLAPLILLFSIAAVVLAMGWHRELSLENLVRHRAALESFVAEHFAAALAGFVGLYIAVVALSVPGAVYLTISAGILFGTWVGGVVSIVGATIGATILFLIARTALGELMAKRAGPLVERIAAGFREDAFSYLLFLRLVPVFPFFLVNLVPALCGVALLPFVAATALGVIPATFAFASVGAGLDSVLVAHQTRYESCLASGQSDCHLDFDLSAAITPKLIAGFVALGAIALLPMVVKRWRARRQAVDPSG